MKTDKLSANHSSSKFAGELHKKNILDEGIATSYIPLTDRQLEVVRLLSEGIRPVEIALNLGTELATVRAHIRAIHTKLKARSSLQAVAIARQLDIVQ
jgi:DNA-binding CsgD family transcriptional regulator